MVCLCSTRGGAMQSGRFWKELVPEWSSFELSVSGKPPRKVGITLDSPAANHSIGSPVHVAPKLLAATEGQVIDHVAGEVRP